MVDEAGDHEVSGLLDRRWEAFRGQPEGSQPGAAVGEALEAGGEPRIAQGDGVQAVRQLAQLVQGVLDLALGLLEAVVELGHDVAAGEPDRERERGELLLRAVVEVALEQPALGLARRRDIGARAAQVLELLLKPGLQALMVETEADAALDLGDDARVVEQAGAVAEKRDRLAVPHERRRRSPGLRRPGAATRVDPAARAAVQEPESRVAEQLG